MVQSENIDDNIENIDVSIIIPAYNEEEVLTDCLSSIIKNNYPKNRFEVIIVNDGSTDRTADIAESFIQEYPNMKILTKENGGKASAQNYGIKFAQGKYILITDADAEVENNWILKMVTYLSSNDMVIGSYYAKNPKTWLEKIQNAHYLIKFKYHGVKGIPPVGVNNSFRKEVTNIVGFFDESKTSITMDYIQRAKEKGMKILFDPSIIVYTKCTTSFTGFFKQKLRWREAFDSRILSLSSIYTYGLSIILFSALIFSIHRQEIVYFVITFFIVYFLSFSFYLMSFLKMINNQEDKKFAFFFIVYEFVEMGIRLILIPYLIYRVIKPRARPTFHTERTG